MLNHRGSLTAAYPCFAAVLPIQARTRRSRFFCGICRFTSVSCVNGQPASPRLRSQRESRHCSHVWKGLSEKRGNAKRFGGEMAGLFAEREYFQAIILRNICSE